MTATADAPLPANTRLPDSPLRRVASRFFSSRLAVVSLGFIAFFFTVALTAGVLQLLGLPMPMDPNATNLAAKLQPPSAAHWLGTDNLGRDVLSRMVAGSTISLTVGFVAMAVSLGIGIILGAVSGYFGGWIDNVLMRIVDALLCFPSFFLILSAIAILVESGLSFLSFGVPPPQATWGNIIADGKTYILDAWWLIVFPGLAIFTAPLAFYIAGDALRRAAETRPQ